MRISFDKSDVDINKLVTWLSEESYWAQGRSAVIIEKSIQNSETISAISDSGEFIGFGRLVTDKATFGWLCDVYVDADYRGQGVGKAIAAGAQEILKELPKFRLLLVTKDAHEVYRSVGFSELENPDRWMFLDKGF